MFLNLWYLCHLWLPSLRILETGVFGCWRKSLRGNKLFFGDPGQLDFLFQKSSIPWNEAVLSCARSATVGRTGFD